jgi:hypothetical protein
MMLKNKDFLRYGGFKIQINRNQNICIHIPHKHAYTILSPRSINHYTTKLSNTNACLSEAKKKVIYILKT